MIQSILFKEWIKTKLIVYIILIGMLGLATYVMMNIFHSIRYNGQVMLWDMIIHKDYIMVSSFKYAPIIVGALLGLFQMVPELQHKRLKLTLHLPIPRHKMIGMMMGYGVMVLTTIFIVSIGVAMTILSFYFSSEIMSAWALALLPWLGAGYLTYLMMSWICIEPTWRMRSVTLIIWGLFVSLFLWSGYSQGVIFMFPYFVAIILLVATTVFYATMRFKEGKQV
ncbi:hypothetical protein K5X82_00520 [Halosquirtibacter xylanolyticus]|uniref:hypothetical protein n=1 Tax=Halosquirtibacter xylanolyticus TaxID=3374599 RepID=UPI00374A3621|nr:hypothetical protein K5X82_00520 [Prolixibacteraceae bacterium]